LMILRKKTSIFNINVSPFTHNRVHNLMATYSTLLSATTNSVLTITLNRPESYNALNEAMKKELNDAFKQAEKEDAVRCIVLRGAGEKAFCSGQDLKEHSGLHGSLKESLEKSYNPLIRKMRAIEKPIIGMINGIAAGAGLSIALACDMRIMSDTAKLIEVFIRIGLVPDSGSHWFLPRLVGMAKAFEYAATGRDIDAAEAERVGLVNRVVGAAELEKTVMDLAEKLAKAPTRSIGLIKRTLNKSLASDLDALLDYEAVIQEIASSTEDHQEGVKAFLAKREAIFKGK
jgi:2-(1,2-epoxy-1,2-dihydrophenyl)acetyl-CoA isomerase